MKYIIKKVVIGVIKYSLYSLYEINNYVFLLYYDKSLLGLLFIGNRILQVSSTDTNFCDVNTSNNCIGNTYYLVNSKDLSLINETDKSGILYYCSGGEKVECNKQNSIGYFVVDKDNVYTCQDEGTGVTCKRTAVTLEACSSEKHIGKLFASSTDTTISLCLNYDTKASTIVLNGGNDRGNYLVYKNADPMANVFGIQGTNEAYAIIGIEDKIVRLNNTYSNGLKFVYVDSSTNRVMEKGDKNYPKLEGASGEPDEDHIMELLCTNGRCKPSDSEVTLSSFTEGINVLKIGSAAAVTDTDFTTASEAENLRMYDCDSNGACEKIAGYVRIATGQAYYYISSSEGNDKGAHAVATEPPTGGCKDKLGLVYMDSDTPKLCVDESLIVDLSTITTNHREFIMGLGESASPFTNLANKLMKVETAASNVKYIYIDNSFKGENGKNYIMELNSKYYAYKYREVTKSFEKDDEQLNGVKNYKPHTNAPYNIYEEYSLSDTTVITSAEDIADWKLFNCRHGLCEMTFGFMKSQNENKYFKYYADYANGKNNEILTESSGLEDECTDGNTYKLTKTGKLCIVSGAEASRRYGPMVDGGVYVVPTINNQESVFKKAVRFVVVKASSRSITLDNLYEDPNTVLTHNYIQIPTSQITDTGAETDNKEKLILYNCSKDGVCTSIGGYAINGNKYYSISVTADPTMVDDHPSSAVAYPVTESADCSSKIGKITKIGKSTYLCLDGTSLMADISHPGYYAFSDNNPSSGSPLTNNEKKKIIQITESFIAIDHTYEGTPNDVKFIIQNENVFTVYNRASDEFIVASPPINGILIYDEDVGTNIFKEVTSPETATSEDIVHWALFDCASSVCVRTYGYVKIADDKYLSIPWEGDNEILSNSDIEDVPCTSASHVGNLMKGGKLCVVPHATAGSEKTYALANDKKYVLSNGNSSIFTTTASANTYFVVKSTTTSFTLDTNVVGVQLLSVNTSSKEIGVIGYSTSDDRANIGLYQCNSNYVCTKISGYAKDGNEGVYYLVDTSNGATAVTTSAASCSGNIGKIVKDENDVKYFCLGTTTKLSLATPPNGYYVVGTVSDGVPITSNKLLKFTADYIVVDSGFEDSSDTSYLLETESEVFKAYTQSNGSFSEDSSYTKIMLFLKEGCSNLYHEVSNLSDVTLVDLSNLLIFNCNQGDCSKINGYIVYGGSAITKCDSSHCNNSASSDIITDSCTAIGKVKLNSGKLNYCLAATGSATELDSSKVYFTGATVSQWVVNEDKTIIANPTPENGVYLTKSSAVVTDTTPADQFISCNGSCTAKAVNAITSSEVGYHIDAFNQGNVIHCVTSPSLSCTTLDTQASDASPKYYLEAAASNPSVISCKTNGCVVEDRTAVKGYFINSAGTTGKAVISCDGTQCSELADASTCSVVGKVKVSGGKVYFCVSTTDADSNHVEIKIDASRSESTKSFKLANSGDFPGFSQNDYISVKIGKDGTALYQAPGIATVIPECGDGDNPNNPAVASGLCNKRGGGTIASGKVCLKSGNAGLYSSSSTCAIDGTLVNSNYYVFKCVNSDNCVKLSDGTDITNLENTVNVLIYQYSTTGPLLTQLKSKYYLDTTNHRLFKCESDGKCAVVDKDGYYSIQNANIIGNDATTHPLIGIATKVATPVAKATIANGPSLGPFYYIDGNSYVSASNYNKLLKCSSDSESEVSCTSYTNKNADAVYPNNPIRNSVSNALIKCDGTYFTIDDGVDTKYYVNGDSAAKFLILCGSGTGCVADNTASDGNVYLDEISESSASYTKLIKCSGDDTITCTSATTNANDVGYYTNGAASTTNLIKCTSENEAVTCVVSAAPAKGFFKNTGKTSYSSCKTTSHCVKYTPEATSCSEKIGELTTSGVLCLDETKTAAFGEGDYLVDIGTSSKFPSLGGFPGTDDHFGYVEASSNSITLNESKGEIVKVNPTTMAIDSNGTAKYNCSSGDCQYMEPCTINSSVGSHCTENAYYLSSTDCSTGNCTPDEESLAGTYLFLCTSTNGASCAKKDKAGIYIKSTTEYYECSDTSCTKKTDTIATKVDCTSGTIGRLYENSGNYYMCLKGSGDPTQLTSINVIPHFNGSKFGTSSGKYAMVTVTSSTTEKSIVLNNAITNGYYLILNGAIVDDTGTQAGSVMVECTSGICSPVTIDESAAGYYRNAAAVNDATLINCSDSACELESKATGFYILNDGTKLECGAGSCTTTLTKSTESCNDSSTNGKITTGNTPTLCLSGSSITASLTTGTTIKYYLSIGNGDGAFGANNSIIKVSKNSFTLATDKKGNICVNKTTLETDAEDVNESDCSNTGTHDKYSSCSSGTNCTGRLI